MKWTLSAEGERSEIKDLLKDKRDPEPFFPWWVWAVLIVGIILMSR